MKIIAESPEMKLIMAKIDHLAPTLCPILFTGETGTGKTFLAEKVHNASGRKKAPFLSCNCANLDHHLLESELFGSVRGAYTCLLYTSPSPRD